MYYFLYIVLVCLYVLVWGDRRCAFWGSARASLWRHWVAVAVWGRQVALDHACCPNNLLHIHIYFICMQGVYNMTGPKLSMYLVSLFSFLDKLGFTLCCSYASCSYTRLRLVTWKYWHTCYTSCSGIPVIIKIICFNCNMENHPEKQCNNNII